MTTRHMGFTARLGILVIALVLAFATVALAHAESSGSDGRRLTSHKAFVTESALLKGLGAGALFPFIDSTPRQIRSAHIAVTDATDDCSAGGGGPSNIVILVGQAGVALESVLTSATNTGIGSESQCVFHVTVRAGRNGLPEKITDIVVVNGGSSALTAFNTVTASATVK